jgi:hypothetical protein
MDTDDQPAIRLADIHLVDPEATAGVLSLPSSLLGLDAYCDGCLSVFTHAHVLPIKPVIF